VIHNSRIPFLDLITPHRELEEELVSVFKRVVHTAVFVGGPMANEFEREFAQFCGADYCVGVGNGTDALRFALVAAGVQQGDAVVTVPNTFIATPEAISQVGARPDFVDVNERTYNMDPRSLQEYLELQCCPDGTTGRLVHRKTRSPVTGIIPVHLYGQMADMDPILELAARHNLLVIEDACQAHGAAYFSQREGRWKKAGAMSKAAAFSFYPGKNLGACGEAGAVTTNDKALAEKVRMLRDHGQRQKYNHEVEGYNGRLDALQAGILLAKLKHLPQWNQQRLENAHHYHELFRSHLDTVTLPFISPQAKSVCHLFVIRVKNRDHLRARLAQADIATQIHYPTPLHLRRPYAFLGYKEGDFPVAEKVAREILSLPMYPHLNTDQQKRVVEKVIESLQPLPVNSRMAQVPSPPALGGQVP